MFADPGKRSKEVSVAAFGIASAENGPLRIVFRSIFKLCPYLGKTDFARSM